MTPRLALVALLTLPLAACDAAKLPGFGTAEEPQVEGHKGPPGVSPLEQPIETGASEARAVSTAEARTYETAAFSARGNEPFWAVDAAGSTALYKTPDNQRGRPVRVNRLAFADGVEYIGVLNGRPFVLTVRARDCQDSMSGEKFPMSAELTVSGRTSRGCAGPASAEVATAVAAIRAPAPAAPRAAAPAASRPAATRPAAAPAATTPATPAPATTTPATPAPATTTPATSTPAEIPAAPEPETTTPPTTGTATGTAPAATPAATPEATSTPAEAPAASPATTLPAPAVTLPATPPVLPAPAPAPAPATGGTTGADQGADNPTTGED